MWARSLDSRISRAAFGSQAPVEAPERVSLHSECSDSQIAGTISAPGTAFAIFISDTAAKRTASMEKETLRRLLTAMRGNLKQVDVDTIDAISGNLSTISQRLEPAATTPSQLINLIESRDIADNAQRFLVPHEDQLLSCRIIYDLKTTPEDY